MFINIRLCCLVMHRIEADGVEYEAAFGRIKTLAQERHLAQVKPPPKAPSRSKRFNA